MKKLIIAIVLVVSALVSGNASALEYPAAFQIKSFYVSNASPFHFRIISNAPTNWLCTNGPVNDSWAFVNEADSGAKAKIAILMMAYSLGKTVSVVTVGEVTGGVTYCHIIEVNAVY